ncbi:MAG: DUF3343 domain-containing protein [Clostridia bacterium]|nr:DUF3343 domain-containing protein [Clostridia bacterium]
MKKTIVLSSVTYALKSQELLKANGIYTNITRSKAVKSVRGCGYGISFDATYYEKVMQLFEQNSIPIIGSIDEK